MPDIKELLPNSPTQGPPVPSGWNIRWPWVTTKTPQQVNHSDCTYGLACIRDHMLRAHLYMSEALRFSAADKITPEAQEKIIQARTQLLCEDDFQQAMDAPPEIKTEVLRLLAATRATWKAIDKTGIDHGFGTIDNIRQIADSIKGLYRKAYEIDRQHRLSEGTAQEDMKSLEKVANL